MLRSAGLTLTQEQADEISALTKAIEDMKFVQENSAREVKKLEFSDLRK